VILAMSQIVRKVGPRRRAAEQRYELAPPHYSMTSSARGRSAGGTIGLSAFTTDGSDRPLRFQPSDLSSFRGVDHESARSFRFSGGILGAD